MKTFTILFISLSLMLLLLFLNNLRSSERIIDSNWYYVNALECKLPIPKDMILKTNVKPYFFYIDNTKRIEPILLNIAIFGFNEEKFEERMKKFKYELLSEEMRLKLYSVTSENKLLGYSIQNGLQEVNITGDDTTETANYMYNYCFNNQIKLEPIEK